MSPVARVVCGFACVMPVWAYTRKTVKVKIWTAELNDYACDSTDSLCDPYITAWCFNTQSMDGAVRIETRVIENTQNAAWVDEIYLRCDEDYQVNIELRDSDGPGGANEVISDASVDVSAITASPTTHAPNLRWVSKFNTKFFYQTSLEEPVSCAVYPQLSEFDHYPAYPKAIDCDSETNWKAPCFSFENAYKGWIRFSVQRAAIDWADSPDTRFRIWQSVNGEVTGDYLESTKVENTYSPEWDRDVFYFHVVHNSQISLQFIEEDGAGDWVELAEITRGLEVPFHEDVGIADAWSVGLTRSYGKTNHVNSYTVDIEWISPPSKCIVPALTVDWDAGESHNGNL